MTDPEAALREAAVAVCQLWFTDNAPEGSQHVRKAMLGLRAALDATSAPAPEAALREALRIATGVKEHASDERPLVTWVPAADMFTVTQGLRAALAATPSPALDVERLADVLREYDRSLWLEGDRSYEDMARLIAREYAESDR